MMMTQMVDDQVERLDHDDDDSDGGLGRGPSPGAAGVQDLLARAGDEAGGTDPVLASTRSHERSPQA